jgi:hypothetical protein
MGLCNNGMAEEQNDQKIARYEKNGKIKATDDEIKSRAVRMVGLIQRGLLEEATSGEYDFSLNQVRVLDAEQYRYHK